LRGLCPRSNCQVGITMPPLATAASNIFSSAVQLCHMVAWILRICTLTSWTFCPVMRCVPSRCVAKHVDSLDTAAVGGSCGRKLFGLGIVFNSAMRVCARVRIPVCPEPPLVFSHEILGWLRTGFLVVLVVSGCFPFTNCICIPPLGARPKL
jgi:hypothetical protein